jgi:hypothetical protein
MELPMAANSGDIYALRSELADAKDRSETDI